MLASKAESNFAHLSQKLSLSSGGDSKLLQIRKGTSRIFWLLRVIQAPYNDREEIQIWIAHPPPALREEARDPWGCTAGAQG